MSSFMSRFGLSKKSSESKPAVAKTTLGPSLPSRNYGSVGPIKANTQIGTAAYAT